MPVFYKQFLNFSSHVNVWSHMSIVGQWKHSGPITQRFWVQIYPQIKLCYIISQQIEKIISGFYWIVLSNIHKFTQNIIIKYEQPEKSKYLDSPSHSRILNKIFWAGIYLDLNQGPLDYGPRTLPLRHSARMSLKIIKGT